MSAFSGKQFKCAIWLKARPLIDHVQHTGLSPLSRVWLVATIILYNNTFWVLKLQHSTNGRAFGFPYQPVGHPQKPHIPNTHGIAKRLVRDWSELLW